MSRNNGDNTDMSRPVQQFSSLSPPVYNLIYEIDNGNIGLPDLQRPFVWQRTRVRDLFDSLYKGFPAGHFLFWKTPRPVKSSAIGSKTTVQENMNMIVDGQQRLTSLYAVMTGKPIINSKDEEEKIRIAFNPLKEEFSVANALTDGNPEFISNISDIWTSGKGSFSFTNDFLKALDKHHTLTQDEKDTIGNNIQKLENIKNYQFNVLMLSGDLDVDTIAEIFQRINTSGITLNSADFILTLMSVHWEEGRHQIEDFSRKAKILPSGDTKSPYNALFSPSPDQLLRVSIGFGLKRGSLRNAYHDLRGRDPQTRRVLDDLRKARFDDLKEAQAKVLNLSNWHEYINCIKAAGFISSSMITSNNNFLYGYLIYLIGKYEFDVGHQTLRGIISRWFFMSTLTGRYANGPETAIEADLRKLKQPEKTAEVFANVLDTLIGSQFTGDYWTISLPEKLNSSNKHSPYLFTYHAALNLLGATALFSNIPIKDHLYDSSACPPRSPIERHHLFPKAYLKKLGYRGSDKLDQIANFAFIEWPDNAAISNQAPSDYFPDMFAQLSAQEQANASKWHGLPEDWVEMDYLDFIKERRKLIADVIKDGFDKVKGDSQPYASNQSKPSVLELLTDMETSQIEFKATARKPLNPDIPEKIIHEGVIKTVAGFMNAQGGTLGIGISDDGDVCGIQDDLDFKRQDIDAYQNWLLTLLINSIGKASVANNVDVRFESIDEEVVCLIDVTKSRAAVYANTTRSKEAFYVRIGNTTRMLEGSELVRYIKDRQL